MPDRENRWHIWMVKARSGDRTAYARLLGDVAERVRRFARSRMARSGHGTDELEDIVQEVLVALHTKRGTWDPSRPVGPWIDAIIRYKTADALRRMSRRAVLTDTLDVVSETIAATPSAVHPADLRDLDRHLDTLPKRERGVVVALSLEGVTVRKCAERLGITEGAVRVAFHRGLQRLEHLANREPALAGLGNGAGR
ncbi:MAG: sigma-70 family RNA polymerase sigma factor [Pseudomonadota bacterium]